MESKSAERRLKARDNEIKALDMRRAGQSLAQVAAHFGCHISNASKIVKRALERLNRLIDEKAEEVRRLELERLDHYLACLDCGITLGDTKAIMAAVKISESRRKLLGVDAPTVQRIETHEQNEEQIKEALKQRGFTL